GSALDKLKEFIENQGGNSNIVEDYSLLPQAKEIMEIKAPKTGYIAKIEAEEVGVSAMMLGAGRETKDDELDLSAGIVLTKKVSDFVNEGETIAYMYYNKLDKIEGAKERFLKAYTISDEKVEAGKLVYGVVTKDKTLKF
ncbi:pyrimidine-nucleoside phosphorylase, partial [Casaltella massiliensis]|nr:pyrimidine-nucleoside phosphorylase [Casaltella massiliensis]